jgi:16S rRNA (guanine966-N2)-methyltransferase
MQTERGRRTGSGKLRIIGGKWRGRKLVVADDRRLRPTPDRVRETLFNWLQPLITGAHCLDLFAGSGVLWFEALSRGADRVVMVESNPRLVSLLQQQGDLLQAQGAAIVCAGALEWLQGNNEKFDIVFLDPPFGEGWLDRALTALVKGGSLRKGSLVYLECEQGAGNTGIDFKEIKQSRAGQVQYRLVEYPGGNNNK